MTIRKKLAGGPLGFGAAPLGNMFRELTDEQTGDRLALVFEGAYASTQALGVTGPACGARDLAAALMARSTGGSAARSTGRSGA